MTVYVDVLIFINTVLNYAVLITAEKLLKREVRLWRLLAGSFTGALFALSVFIDSGALLPIALRIISSAIITVITFGFKSKAEYLKAAAMTVAVSALYCGGIILFYQLIRPPNMLIINDVPYLQLDPLLMLLFTDVIYIALLLLDKLFFKRIKSTIVKLRFTIDEKEYSCIGKIDTGCNLTEPFSGSPVIIADNSLITVEEGDGARLIPYSTLSGSSFLFAVKAGSVTVDSKPVSKAVYIASAKLENPHFQAIINSDILR